MQFPNKMYSGVQKRSSETDCCIRSREGEVGNGGGGDLDGVPAGVEDGGVVGDEDVDAVDVGGGATRSGR